MPRGCDGMGVVQGWGGARGHIFGSGVEDRDKMLSPCHSPKPETVTPPCKWFGHERATKTLLIRRDTVLRAPQEFPGLFSPVPKH